MRKYITSILFSLLSLVAIAQTVPSFNAVRFVGSDSTSAAVTVNGTLRVNPVTGELRLRRGGTWTRIGSSGGGGGSSTFVGLTDGPGSFSGHGLDYTRVNSGATSLEYRTPAQVASDISAATLTGTQTLANKRVTPRVQSITSSATVTPNADSDDLIKVTAQAAGLTLANPSGTPTDGQALIVRVKDNGTSRTLTFGSQYRFVGVEQPAATTISKILYLGMVWNADESKWDVIGLSLEQ